MNNQEKEHYVVSTLEQWRHDMTRSANAVHMHWYEIWPQATGFMITFELYVAGDYNPELGGKKETSFSSSLYGCIKKIELRLEQEKNHLILSLGK